eukprot:m.115832 g.115832  ORF g.115832 m.115832 type:complete len:61 (+) comp37567_c0_seq2:284-466(+)
MEPFVPMEVPFWDLTAAITGLLLHYLDFIPAPPTLVAHVSHFTPIDLRISGPYLVSSQLF